LASLRDMNSTDFSRRMRSGSTTASRTSIARYRSLSAWGSDGRSVFHESYGIVLVDEAGTVRLLEPLHLSSTHRALVTILDETHPVASPETALLSESALAADWNRPEEDAAWSHLQRLS